MTTDPTAVRQHITVDVPQERAFRVFTEQFDGVKPHAYNLLPVPIEETVLEPRPGGSVYDRGIDGSTCRWGRVLAFEPPARLVLSWDISTQWQIEDDPARCSEVEVSFVAIDEEHTRVEIVHRHLDRHGDGWQEYRAGVEGGWPSFLENLRTLTLATADPA